MGGMGLALLDQRHVTGMERPHRRHQRDGAAIRPKRGDGLPERIDGTNDLHE
jgi:hypothetical protein